MILLYPDKRSLSTCFCEPFMYPARNGWVFFGQLMRRGSVPIDFIVTNRVTVLTAAIAGVTLDSVDAAILHLLHDTNMVGRTILAAIIPIEKDNVARARLIAVVLPQSALLEPRHTLRWCWPARSPTGTPRSE